MQPCSSSLEFFNSSWVIHVDKKTAVVKLMIECGCEVDERKEMTYRNRFKVEFELYVDLYVGQVHTLIHEALNLSCNNCYDIRSNMEQYYKILLNCRAEILQTNLMYMRFLNIFLLTLR